MSDDICTFVVAVNAIFLLFRWGKWEELKALGLNRKIHEPQLHSFDMRVIISERGRIRHIRQTVKLVEYCPDIFSAACKLLAIFKKVEQMDEQFRAACLSYLRINGLGLEGVPDSSGQSG